MLLHAVIHFAEISEGESRAISTTRRYVQEIMIARCY